jgi:hypothetical protein
MDSMKASQYKEAHRRLKYSGLYREVPEREKSAILTAWDANADTLGRGESFLAKGREKHIDNILQVCGVDRAEVPVKKLYAHLNRGISFEKLVVVLERSLGAHNRAVQVAEELFVAVDRIPPVPRELHEQMLKTQEEHLPERLKPNEAGFPAKEWVKAQLRPIMKRPLAIAAQAHLKEVKRLNDEAVQQQDFLPDGRPAGIQHVLSEQAAKRNAGGTMAAMTNGEMPAGTGGEGSEGALEQKKLDFIAAVRAILSKLSTPAALTDQDISALELIATKTLTTFSDVAVTAVDTGDGGIRFTFDGNVLDGLEVTKAEKDVIDTILSEQNVPESVKAARAEFGALISNTRNTSDIGRIQFKHLQQLVRLCEPAPTVQFSYLDDAHQYALNSRETFTRGREFSLDGAIVGAITSADMVRFNDIIGSELVRRVEAEARKISGNKQAEVVAISEILGSADWSPYIVQARQGTSIEAPLHAALQSLKATSSTDVQDMRTHRALTALAAGLGYNHLAEFFAPVLGENTDAHAHRPRVLNKILVEGKKYKDAAEQQFVAGLLALTDGVDKAWGTYSLQIVTDATTGTKTYTYTGRDSAKRTFTLTSEELTKLANAGLETGSEKEVEGMKLAMNEIQTRLSKIERDSTNDGLDADKKAKNIQYIDLLLKDKLTFPGVYFVRNTKKPKDGERSEDERIKVSLLKNISADAVTISGNPIPGYDGPIPNIIIEKAKLIALKAKFEQKKIEEPKMPGDLNTALSTLRGWDKTKYFDNDAQRAVLDTYLKPFFETGLRPAKIGIFDVTDEGHSFKFSKDGKRAFTLKQKEDIRLWREISAIPPLGTPSRNAPIDAARLTDESMVNSKIDNGGRDWTAPILARDIPDRFKHDLAARIGARMLQQHNVPGSDKVGFERAREYVKALPWWKRWGAYIALGALASGIAYATGLGALAFLPKLFPALVPGSWGLFGAKIAASGVAAFATVKMSRMGLDAWWKSNHGVGFFEHAKDSAGYFYALRRFKKEKKHFDKSETNRIKLFDKYKGDGVATPARKSYEASLGDVMAWHEKGRRREQIASMVLPAIGSIGTGYLAYQYFPGFGTPTTNGPRGGPGVPPPNGPRGAGILQPTGRVPAYTPTGGLRAPVLVDSMVYNITCGHPSGIPVRAIIDGNTVNWYMNGFYPSMRVSCVDGGLHLLLGSLDQVPQGGSTRRAISELFSQALNLDPDLRDTFLNRGNRSSGKWFDYAVLREYTWMNGRKQLMIDAMMERTNNPNVKSTLAAMKQSIMGGNIQLSVRRA